jgi:hypothetical protein
MAHKWAETSYLINMTIVPDVTPLNTFIDYRRFHDRLNKSRHAAAQFCSWEEQHVWLNLFFLFWWVIGTDSGVTVAILWQEKVIVRAIWQKKTRNQTTN